MEPASLALWLNVLTESFAAGYNDATPYFAPLNVVQNGQYTTDIYYVSPTGNAAAPWTYNDPSSFLQASLAFGNRLSYNQYAGTSSFTRLVDQYGPKARFSINLVSSQLNSDLSSLASVPALFQATWQTSIASGIAQLSTVIAKALGLTNLTNFITAFPNITTLTGTASTALAAIPTAGSAVALLQIVEVVGTTTAGVAAQYQLQTYTGAQSLPGIVLPNDFNAVTNPVAWFQIS